jgi:hypothetical protein
MTAHTHPRSVAAPRVTAALAGLFVLVVLAQAAFAGGLAGGHHMWLSWHENVGDLLVVLPLASLIAGLAFRRRQADTTAMMASRVTLVVLVVAVVATGHAGGGWLAFHIPAAVATVGLATRQAMIAHRAAREASASIKHLPQKETAS